MKARKTFLTLTIVGLMAVLLCLPASVFAGPGPNPGGQDSTKTIGPSPKGLLLVGWKPNLAENGSQTDEGTLEAFVWVNGQLFIGIPETSHPENEMRGAIPFDITTWLFSPAIADYFGFPMGTLVIVQKEMDVSDFDLILDIEPTNSDYIWNPYGAQAFSYKHMLACNVKFSFVVPK